MKRQQDYTHTDSFFTAEQMTGSGQLDMLAQISEMSHQRREEKVKGKPIKRYVVEATCTIDSANLDADDQDCLETIIEPFECDAIDEDDALDLFHGCIPISCLDDFDIECKEIKS